MCSGSYYKMNFSLWIIAQEILKTLGKNEGIPYLHEFGEMVAQSTKKHFGFFSTEKSVIFTGENLM